LRERDDFLNETLVEFETARFAKIRERGRLFINPSLEFLKFSVASLTKFSLSLKGREES
jgi:hypothetical protein